MEKPKAIEVCRWVTDFEKSGDKDMGCEPSGFTLWAYPKEYMDAYLASQNKQPKSLIAEHGQKQYRKGFSDAEFTVKNAMLREARLTQQEDAAFLEEQARNLQEAAQEITRSFGDDFAETQGAEDLAEVIAALSSKAKEMRK